MKKAPMNANEIAINMRRTFGCVKPYTVVFKSKKQYSRKDKSWRKED